MAVNLGAPDSENPKRKRKRRKLLLDAKVEVRSLEEGFLGSWHPGTVIACEDGVRHVKYHHLLRDDGSENLVDVVAVSPIIDGIVASNGTRLNYRGCIRPLPPMINFGMWGLHYGLCVDAFFKEAWWEGVIFDHEDGLDERKIFFPDLGDEEKIGIGMLRITHDWDEGTENWERRGNWLFLELIEEYELERPLVVSVKQIWYDLQEKEGFRKVGEWTSSKKALWKELVLEVINDNLELTVNEISCSLDFFGDLVPQPVLELPEPALDVVLDPESNLANACAVVPFENHRLLDRDMIVDHGTNQMTLLEFSIKDVDKRVENGLLATGMPHTNLNSTSIEPVEERSDPDGLISAVEDDGLGVNLVTYSNTSCQDKAIGVQQQELSVIPSNLDGISSISFNTKSEGFSSVSCRKSCRKSSTCGENPNWELPDGCNTLTGAEYCPGAITEYALSKMANKRPGETLTKNVRKHLSFLRWEIKCKRYKDTIRMRYTSPEGKIYYSLYQLCQDLREVDKILSPVSIDDQRSLPTSPDDLPSSPVIEQPQVSKEMTKVPPPDNVLVEPEYCPQAVVDWYILGDKQRSLDRDKRQDMILKAKKHLSAVGWVFCYANKKGKHELRYKSPRGKCYISLQKACKGFIDEGGVSESSASACRPAKSAHMSAEAEVHLANEKLSSAITGTEYEGSLVPQNLPFEKRLALYPAMTQSNELAVLGKGKVRGIRKLRKKRENGLLHLVSPLLQCQTQADLHARQDGLEVGLIGNRKRRHPKDQNASFPKPKKRKVSGALIKLGVDGSCPPRVLRSSKRARQVAVPNSSHHNPRTVLSWLIDNNVVLPREKVHYRGRKDRSPMAEGRITRDGIKCSCCQKVFTLTQFEAHAGSTCHRPAANIFLGNGRSLLECQIQMIGEKNIRGLITEPRDRLKGHWRRHTNDYICSVCHYGGELILCDQCPSSFHKSCLGLKDVPEGDWFCLSCCCGICGQSTFIESTEHHTDNSVLNCDQCEHRYHVGCLRKKGLVKLDSIPKGCWFCSRKCEKIFVGLQKLLGKPVAVGVDNLTWTLLKSTKYDSHDIEALTENYSKLNVALGLMHECFEPVKEPHTRRDLVEDVIFSRGSDLNRLNFRGFYTVLLERNDELITVATVRVYGEKVAEVPLVGTRFQYRRLGMCRILMNELEKKLMELGVERLILPAVPSVLHTWTTAFGFSKMTDSERLKFLDHTFLDFQGTTMCQKLLNKIPSAEASLSRGTRIKIRLNTNGRRDNIDFDGYSAVSEVFQAEQVEDSEIVNQGSMDISVGNSSHGSTGTTSLVDVLTQPTHLEHKSSYGEIYLECSDEDANHQKEGRGDANGQFKCYKRRKVPASGS